MTKLIYIGLGLVAMTGFAMAGAPAPVPVATPGPLLGAVAGPWGLAASALGYGAYRLYKSRRS